MRLRLILLLTGLPGLAVAQPATPVGRWLTEKHDGVIEIAPCGASLCGRIVGMQTPLGADGRPARDTTGVPKCGLRIIDQTEQRAPDQWHAAILDPDTGRNWNCDFTVAPDGTLHLRGYVVIRALGETQVWSRYQGQLGADCRMG